MKIISFEKMLAMPEGTVFCMVDVADDFAMGALCRKEHTEGDKFEYTFIGSKVSLDKNDSVRSEFVDNACDELKINGVFREALLEEAVRDAHVFIESVDTNPLCTFAVYERADLQYMVDVLHEGIDVLDGGVNNV